LPRLDTFRQYSPLPRWVIFHVPHDSMDIPDDVMDQFTIGRPELAEELLRMTDHHTLDLLVPRDCQQQQVVRSPVSRLVVDMERFQIDSQEVMASVGMGVIYERTSGCEPLRRPISMAERTILIDQYYVPHHARLTEATEAALANHGQALVLDAHSFPARPLPYELDQNPDRPQICLGSDAFHTPTDLELALLGAFKGAGFTVRLNSPFAGALVPLAHYRVNPGVVAVMVEVNRSIYMDESTGVKNENFELVATMIQDCITLGINVWAAKA